MLQAIQIETQAQQKSLALLHQQRGAGRSRACVSPRRGEFRSKPDAGRAVAETIAASWRARRGCARFSFPAWQESRSARRVASRCKCDSLRCRTRRRPIQARSRFTGKPSRRPQADSYSRSRAPVARSEPTGTADPHPPRPPTSTNASTAVAFARDDACAARKRC
jgi:hypothetical protein